MKRSNSNKKIHDIKNALGVILLTAQVLALKPENPTSEKILKAVAEIDNQVRAICTLLDSMRDEADA
ncbi:MAG: hypothetical protein AAB908_02250 [Patescibacteria group bacterium]